MTSWPQTRHGKEDVNFPKTSALPRMRAFLIVPNCQTDFLPSYLLMSGPIRLYYLWGGRVVSIIK